MKSNLEKLGPVNIEEYMTHQPTYRVTVRVRVTTNITVTSTALCVASRRNCLQSLEGVDECRLQD